VYADLRVNLEPSYSATFYQTVGDLLIEKIWQVAQNTYWLSAIDLGYALTYG
jgi:hypothetical protein